MMNTANVKTEYTHDLLKKWILENRPESGTPAKFYSYEFLFFAALELRENPDETLTAKDIKEIICGDLETISEALWMNDIAVQPEAVESDRVGIRVMNLF